MAQVPATPKGRRWRIMAKARIRGAEAARALPDLQPSEIAALTLRANGRPTRPVKPKVAFLIPLVSPDHVSDWAAVVDHLSATIASFRRQTSGAWRATICCQEKPDLPWGDQLTFLPFEATVEGNDKWAKLRHLAETVDLDDGYVMPFDADDLLAPEAVAHMVQHRAPGGYLVSNGYVLDMAAKRCALAAPPSPAQPLRKPFWKLCGSCAALRVTPQTAKEDRAFLAEATQHEHRMFPYLAKLAGRPLAPLPSGSALYVLNHGENFGARRGRISFKTRFTKRFAVRDAGELDRIRNRFSLAPTLI